MTPYYEDAGIKIFHGDCRQVLPQLGKFDLLLTVIRSTESADENGHPCPKPLGWMKWLLNLAALDGETVLDPFCGSGTTLVAAKDMGLSAVGIESEERYCEIAANRLRQGVLNFEPERELCI